MKEEDDASVAKVRSFFETVQRAWDEQVLGTLSALVEPVKGLFQRFSAAQLDFLASLARNESLIKVRKTPRWPRSWANFSLL